MGIILGDNRYGKSENRVVRIYRDTSRHEIRDLTVSTSLRGAFEAAHIEGDQSDILPTDSQKNTAFAYAKSVGVDSGIEEYGLALARHFVMDVAPVRAARIDIDQVEWARVVIDGTEHDHTWVRAGQEVRTASITVDASRQAVVGGLRDLVLLKSTGSEFHGFLKDEYTTLPETHDRIMSTSLTARWRFGDTAGIDWDRVYSTARTTLVSTFATVHSLALQQTLWRMGRALLETVPELVEVRLSAPNKHHVLVDLEPFGLANPGEVFVAVDRPYGMIEAQVLRDDAPPAGEAWFA